MTTTPPARPRLRRIAGAVVTDVRPLRRSADYRRLWFGTTVSQLGQQMTAVAVAVQVFALTSSTFAVGLLGLCALVPIIGFGLYGGSIVDAFDRRRVSLISSTGLWLLSFVLVVQAVVGIDSVVLLCVVVALQAACFAVNSPARAAIIPRLLPAELLPAANALSSTSFNLGFTIGPLLGGVLLGLGDFSLVYAVDCVTFGAAVYALIRLPPIPPEGEVRRAGLASVLEGLRFLATRPNVLMTFLVDLCAMVLAQPRALFVAVAAGWYGGGNRTVGLLAAAPALGSVLAALVSGWLGRIRRQGLAVLLSVMAYGLVIALFGLTRSLWLGVLFLALSGAADLVSSVFRGTILQDATPDALRGRLQGVFIVVVAGGPRLGEFASGSVAEISTPAFAVIAGGCACMLATAALAARFRGFARYDARTPTP